MGRRTFAISERVPAVSRLERASRLTGPSRNSARCYLCKVRSKSRLPLLGGMLQNMSAPAPIDVSVRREMLRLALHNSFRTIPLQVLAVAYFVTLGWMAGLPKITALAALLGLIVAIWRFALKRYGDVHGLSDARMARIQLELEGNSA